MRITANLIGLAASLVFTATAAVAQEAKAATPPSQAPALVPSVTISPDDSPLVRAAKLAAAKRQKSHTAVIDNKAVKNAKGANVTESKADLPPVLPQTGESAPIVTPGRTGPPAEMQPDQIAQRIEKLKGQMEHLSVEADAPYGSELDPALICEKMKSINDEIARLQKMLPKKP
jgi:hypothetical protein